MIVGSWQYRVRACMYVRTGIRLPHNSSSPTHYLLTSVGHMDDDTSGGLSGTGTTTIAMAVAAPAPVLGLQGDGSPSASRRMLRRKKLSLQHHGGRLLLDPHQVWFNM